MGVIQLKQRNTPPPTLISSEVRTLVESLKARVNSGEKLKSRDFNSRNWLAPDVKRALYEMHHNGKCCYCERRRDERREPDVEHFRPKADVEDVDHPGYWWLAYDWNNYFFSCKKCNQEHKKNKFPLMDENSRAYSPNDNIEDERPFLINPETENPESLIGFEWTKAWGIYVKAIGTDDELRGHTTIKVLGLNEGVVPGQRAEIVHILQTVAETMHAALKRGPEREVARTAELIKKETAAEREFAGFRRLFFKSQGLGEYISDD